MLTDKQLARIQKIIGYPFQDINLLKNACVAVHKGTDEALGDGILDVICGQQGLKTDAFVSNKILKKTTLGKELKNYFAQKKIANPGIANLIERIFAKVYIELKNQNSISKTMEQVFVKIFRPHKNGKPNQGLIVKGIIKIGCASYAAEKQKNRVWRAEMIDKLLQDLSLRKKIHTVFTKNQNYQAATKIVLDKISKVEKELYDTKDNDISSFGTAVLIAAPILLTAFAVFQNGNSANQKNMDEKKNQNKQKKHEKESESNCIIS